MKRIALVLLILSVAVSTISCGETKKETISPEEAKQLRETHPQFFDLDTSEGLNVLVYNGGKSGVDWSVRLVPGNKDHYSLFEGIQATTYLPLTVAEAKKVLIYYGLPDNKIILRPYDDPMASSYTLAKLMEDPAYLTQMAEAFDNRFRVGETFKSVYDPEFDNVKNSSNQMIDSFELEKYQWEINNYQINRNVGLVPDKDTAVNIAKKLWYEKYSETISYSEIKVSFDNKNECWHIFNTVEPDVLGGIFHVLIEKNGKVIAVWAED